MIRLFVVDVLEMFSFLLRLLGLNPGGILPCKSDRGARWKILRTPLKGIRIFFHGCVPKSFLPLRGTNLTTKIILLALQILIVIKITFEHFLLNDFLKVLP